MSSTPPSVPAVEAAPQAPVASSVHRMPMGPVIYDSPDPRGGITPLGWYGLILWALLVLVTVGLALT